MFKSKRKRIEQELQELKIKLEESEKQLTFHKETLDVNESLQNSIINERKKSLHYKNLLDLEYYRQEEELREELAELDYIDQEERKSRYKEIRERFTKKPLEAEKELKEYKREREAEREAIQEAVRGMER